MRDVLILGFLLAGSLYALRQPWVGAVLWTWVSVMNPHQQFGWAVATWPVGLMVALATLIGALFTRDKINPFSAPAVWLLAAFVVWTCITLPFSFYFDSSLPLWERSMKIWLMLLVTIVLLDTPKKLNVFIAVVVLSLAFYGVKGGVFTLVKGGAFRVWGPGGFIGGNNELALALVMTIPLMRYLQTQLVGRWGRAGLGLCMVLTAITVLGTYSRGALLALAAMAAFMWLKGSNKIRWGAALLLVGALALPFMPEQWWDRMDTIQSYEVDASALGRLNAWKMAWNLASANFFGGGFSIYTPAVFARYSPEPERVHAAHSIYFQVLGEHGFVGLALFIALGVLVWVKAGHVRRLAAVNPEARWALQLGPMVQASLVGYAVGGAFLSLAYFDLPYNLLAMVVVAAIVIEKGARQGLKQAGAASSVPTGKAIGTLRGARR